VLLAERLNVFARVSQADKAFFRLKTDLRRGKYVSSQNISPNLFQGITNMFMDAKP
jgi:hypothetical protein